MTGQRVALVEQVYSAFGRGDVDALGRLLADTDWQEAEGMPYGGLYHGAAEIFAAVFGPIGRDVQGFSARPDEILAAGEDKVLALGRYRGQGAKGELDAGYAHVWTVRDGAIAAFVQYADTHLFRQATGL